MRQHLFSFGVYKKESFGIDNLKKMKNKFLFVIFSLIFLGFVMELRAQVFLVPSSGSQRVIACGGTVYDHAGTGNYVNSCNGYLIIQAPQPGMPLTLSGTFDTESISYDWIKIYDGNGLVGTLLGTFGGHNGTLNVTSNTGFITIQFRSDGSSVYSGFELTLSSSADPCLCGGGPANITLANSTSNSAEITWTAEPGFNYIIEYGPEGFTPGQGISQPANNGSFTATNLIVGTTYDFRVYVDCDNDGQPSASDPSNYISVCTGTRNNCIDYANLTGPNVLCQTGTYANPYQANGVVSGRHTVMSDPTAFDPKTNNQLQIVPDCYQNSVRLGNNLTGAEAEAITYSMTVDTNDADILLFKYAAVLEDPSHSSYEQPKFTFQILNQNNQEIDPICGSATFVSGPSLGWQAGVSGVLWKDWTDVGVILSQYHGQTIKLRFTTYDCDQSGHFGYAYFVISCAKKRIQVQSCGNVSNLTYSAPDGFNYRWFLSTNPSQTISTSQTATVSTSVNATLFCDVSFIDNANCSFQLSTEVQLRYPLAEFSFAREHCSHNILFTDESAISQDAVTPDGSGEHCESHFWDFGDGETSTEQNPSHRFAQPGSYTVTYIAGLNNGICTDTITHVVDITQFVPQLTGPTEVCTGDTVMLDGHGGVSYQWSTGQTTSSIQVMPTEDAEYQLIIMDADGCPDTLTHNISIFPTFTTNYADTICQGDNYDGYGFVLNNVSRAGLNTYRQQRYTVNGCDSSIVLSLTVNPLPVISLGKFITVCFEEDGAPYLDAGADYDSYLWSTGATTRTIQAPDSGYYSCTAVQNGCVGSDSVHVRDMCAFRISLPNTITPSEDDGLNDYFHLPSTDRIKTMEIYIYDRWGQLVFQSTDPNFKWDGRVRGKLVANTVFNYRLIIVPDDNLKRVYKGHINVL